ncbi:MAG: ester cyclase [Candidatus Glassbacteria bacterium]
MSAEANKALVKRYWDGKWNQRCPGILDELQTPDVAYHGPSCEMQGLDQYKDLYNIYLTALQETQVTVEDLIAEGEKVVSRIVLRGVNGGPLPDLPATGRPVVLTLFTIFRIVDGKIAEEWEAYDELGFMQQLGLELKPKAEL